jgi:hypothetical protein
MTDKNATYYIEEAKSNKWTTAPEAPMVVITYNVFSGTSEMEVLERVLVLLDQTGIPYSYSNFIIHIGTARMCCTIEIYRNKGTNAKTHVPNSLTTSTILPDTDTFIIALWDRTRYFSLLFRYIIQNYSVENITQFTYEDLNYGLYCPEPTQVDAALAFHEECSAK